MAMETFGALAAAYMYARDPVVRAVADTMYAKAFGKPGSVCEGEFAAHCGDGVYASAVENTYAGGYWFDTDKYFGFAFGFGGVFAWPAARLQ
jgi:hypothetical protein